MSDAPRDPAAPAAGRRLVLVRHAKAVSDSGGSDRDRALTDRGRKDSATIGKWLAARLDRVDAVWSSSALRARQTWEAIAAVLGDAPAPELRDDIYDAGPDDLLEMVRAADDGIAVLVVVGHNPTIERLQAWLSDDDRGFPAGAAAIIDFSGSWAGLEPGAGRLADFRVP